MKTTLITIAILLVPLLSVASEEAILVIVSVWAGPEQEIRQAFDNVPPTKEPIVGAIGERFSLYGAYNSAQLNKLLDVMKRLEGVSPHRSINEVITTKDFTIGMPRPSSLVDRDLLSLKMQPSADLDLVNVRIAFEDVSFVIACKPAEWIVLGFQQWKGRECLVILKLSKEKLGLRIRGRSAPRGAGPSSLPPVEPLTSRNLIPAALHSDVNGVGFQRWLRDLPEDIHQAAHPNRE